jgi:hypothetical protein
VNGGKLEGGAIAGIHALDGGESTFGLHEFVLARFEFFGVRSAKPSHNAPESAREDTASVVALGFGLGLFDSLNRGNLQDVAHAGFDAGDG